MEDDCLPRIMTPNTTKNPVRALTCVGNGFTAACSGAAVALAVDEGVVTTGVSRMSKSMMAIGTLLKQHTRKRGKENNKSGAKPREKERRAGEAMNVV